MGWGFSYGGNIGTALKKVLLKHEICVSAILWRADSSLFTLN